MKTAMQELMDKVQSINERYELKEDANWLMNEIIDLIENSFEKEKEQIIDTYRISSINNSSSDDIQNIRPEYWQVNAEMWYDKHYNQNK